jgi:putative ABC transport system permease protein
MTRTTFRLAARNTLRRRARTFFTAGMVLFAVAVLLVASTWVGGIFSMMLSGMTAMGGHVRVVDPEFAAREELMPLYENLEKTTPLVALLERQPGVLAVEPRIMTGVTVTQGEEIGDVFAMAVGANERYFREQLGAKEKLIAGTWFTGAPDELIAGAKVAERTGARVGDELVLLGATQDGSLSPIKGKLVGIVRSGAIMLDQQVWLPLEKARWLTDIPEGATELLVFAAGLEEGRALAGQLKALPELRPYAVQSWDEREPLKSMIGTVAGMQGAIVFTFVFLAALGIWNTMTMSVLERTHEIGVLRAMGMSRLSVVGMFVGEALAIAAVGGGLGLLLGVGPAWLLETRGIHIGDRLASSAQAVVSETIRGDLTLEGMVNAFALGLLMALLGSLLPALRAASIQPVSAIRSGR